MKLVLISDPGQDSDDEMALVLLSELCREGEVEPLAVVANLQPSARRAALVRGTLDMLGLHEVPVGIGTDGGSSKHTDTFSEYISEGKTGVDYIKLPLEAVAKVKATAGTTKAVAVAKEARIWEGQHLLADVLEHAEEKSVSLLLLSSLKDAAQVLREQEAHFRRTVKSVTIMGGAQVLAKDGVHVLVPDETAHNNCFDLPAAKFFYQRVQELGIQLIVLSRFAAYGCPVQRSVYDLMVRCPVPNPVVCRLHAAQRASIERLWRDVCTGERLPARCDRKWYCDTFCNGQGCDRAPNDSMWDLVQNFNMYDPLALLASIPAWREWFFKPDLYIGQGGVEHLIIGSAKDKSGISSSHVVLLQDFLLNTWIRAAGRLHGTQLTRPRELDSEHLTAALNPMQKHSDEELTGITQHVLLLLNNEWPKLKGSSLSHTWMHRDRLMKEIGPPMVLLHWETIERLGRIPHSEENQAISMAEAEGIARKHGKRFFIEMFSHRWNSLYAPDDRWNSKARVLVEWAKYRWSIGLGTFFWIDYACINQSDVAPGVAMLPLYVSSCNNILCYEMREYEGRAWCRVERLMFAAFVAPNNEFISQYFRFSKAAERLANNELKPRSEERAMLPDPEEGHLSYPADVAIIRELKNLCTKHWGKCWRDDLLRIVEEKNGLKGVRSLQLGETEVRLRRF